MAYMTYKGSTIEVSAGRPATVDAAGFAAKTYTMCKHIKDWAEMGDTSQDVAETTLDGRTWHTNGPDDGGSIPFLFLEDGSDPGQNILLAANNGSSEVSVKVTYPNGKIAYAFGVVASIRERGMSDGGGVLIGKTGEFRVNSRTIRV